jgi:hypothetical protein
MHMRTNYVLVDYENVPVQSLTLLKAEYFNVKVFLGPNNSKISAELAIAMQQMGARAEYITLASKGANALDFHIAYYIGFLAATESSAFFHIISKDTGFDPLIQHLKARKISVCRSTCIAEMPCFTQACAAPKSEISPPNPTVTSTPKAAPSAKILELAKAATDDLIKRKASKPRTTKTLWTTIQAKCGKDLPKKDIDNVIDELMRKGYVKVSGTKVTYNLPAL